ncbi:MAG: hypothetical protein MI923_15465 [Phycisphaerales bacterium]|nr:hypothetical protein [Phycisphaerales bacterium]
MKKKTEYRKESKAPGRHARGSHRRSRSHPLFRPMALRPIRQSMLRIPIESCQRPLD